MRALLRQGANPNEPDPDTGKTPLMWLCEMRDNHTKERKRMFRYLIKAGATLDARDKDNSTAWDYARDGASKSFRAFVKREYQRIIGKPPSRTVRRADLPGYEHAAVDA